MKLERLLQPAVSPRVAKSGVRVAVGALWFILKPPVYHLPPAQRERELELADRRAAERKWRKELERRVQERQRERRLAALEEAGERGRNRALENIRRVQAGLDPLPPTPLGGGGGSAG